MNRAPRIEFLEVVDSTQRVAQAYVLAGDTRWDAICADHQTAGRGRQGAHWFDAPAQSLLVSLILREVPPQLPPHFVGVGVAIASALTLEHHFPPLAPVGLKFPNDLILLERKVGGVLVERIGEVYIAGVGINLLQERFPDEIASTAISVRMAVESGEWGVGSGENALTHPRPPSPEAPGEGGSQSPLSHSVGEGQGVRATETGHQVEIPRLRLGMTKEALGEGQGVRATETGHQVEIPRLRLGMTKEALGEGLGVRAETPLSHSTREGQGVRAIEYLFIPHSPLPTPHSALQHALITTLWDQLHRLFETPPEAWYPLWQARDKTVGRAYQILDLPEKPIGTATEVDPAFRIRVRLSNGAVHTTVYASAVASVR